LENIFSPALYQATRVLTQKPRDDERHVYTLAHAQRDSMNPILAATGYNYRRILKWIRELLCKIWSIWSVNQSNNFA